MIQKILAVWLWFEFNIGFSPTKTELSRLLKINFYTNKLFYRSIILITDVILSGIISKNYYSEKIPEVDIDIYKLVQEAEKFVYVKPKYEKNNKKIIIIKKNA